MAGGGAPEGIAGSGLRAVGVGQRLGHPIGGLGGLRVVEQRVHDGHRDQPAVVAGLRVDHAQLHVAARPHGREQRGEVVVQVLGGGRPQGPPLVARPQPVAEGRAARDVPRLALVRPYAHHLGVQRLAHPAVPRSRVQRRREGAPAVQVVPDPLTGAAPARVRTLVRGGVGEGGHQDRAQQVREAPAPAVAEHARLLVPGVHAHLHRGGGAHHGAAGRAGTVEVGLHRVVARAVQQPVVREAGVAAESVQDQSLLAQCGTDGGEVVLEPVHAAGEGGGGGRAEFELTARFDGHPGVQGQCAGRGVRRPEPLGGHAQSGPLGVQDQPFEFGTDQAGRAGLETDPVDQVLRLRLADRGGRGSTWRGWGNGWVKGHDRVLFSCRRP